jgi:UTP-glucose-1-phosphate uridylyltransferase
VEEAVVAGIEEILIISNLQKTSIENHFDRSCE